MKPVVLINTTLCTGCQKCVEVCKNGVLYINDFTGLAKVRNVENCDKNGACIKVCAPKAIKIS